MGTIKATALIETLPAAFEMDEILYELREHMAGLNCGRWDYIFSFIKTLASNKKYVLPDRSQVVMSKAFLANYSALLIKTCHNRAAFAMGGMAAQIPNRKDAEANELAFDKVRDDKEREARNGHDGTWVAHPDLVPVAMEVFNALMPTPNQLYVKRDDVNIGQKELLEVHKGSKTEAGFRENIRVGVQYIEAWLRGRGAVPIYNLMEDAATAEISRSQIWQWLKFGATLDTGAKVTRKFFDRCMREEMKRVKQEVGVEAYQQGRFKEAVSIFKTMSTSKNFEVVPDAACLQENYLTFPVSPSSSPGRREGRVISNNRLPADRQDRNRLKWLSAIIGERKICHCGNDDGITHRQPMPFLSDFSNCRTAQNYNGFLTCQLVRETRCLGSKGEAPDGIFL